MRCNNHKCVKTPLWRGDLIWSWLDLLICRFMLDVKSRSWLILVQVPFCTFDCEKFFTWSLHPMATPTASSSSNKMEQQPPDRSLLQLDADINQVNWSHVRHYMTERFSHPPTCFVQRQGVALLDHVDRSQICDHILNLRPCPSFFDADLPCKMYHPEFLLQNDVLLWTPRTWPCHAYQRRRDLWKQCWNCEIPHCGQLHRQGWEHSEMFGFRAWVAASEPRYWFSVYCLEPNYSGRLPLYTIDFQDLQNCLATQPFITPELHDKHDWKDSVPPPPTYILEVPSRVCPLASNFKEPERVQRRKMQHRDPTPRGHRSTPRDSTPQRREFLPAQTPSYHANPGPSPRFGPGTPPRSRQPTGSENWRPSNFPPAIPPDLRSALAPRHPTSGHMGLNALQHLCQIRCLCRHHRMPPCLLTMLRHLPAQSSIGMLTQTLMYLCLRLGSRFRPAPSGLRPHFPPTLWPTCQIGSPGPFHLVIAETFTPSWRVDPRSLPLSLIGNSLLVSWKTTSVPSGPSTKTLDPTLPWQIGECCSAKDPSTATVVSTMNRLSPSHCLRTPLTQNYPFWPASSTWRCRGNYLWPSPIPERVHRPSPRPSSAIGSNLPVTTTDLHAPNKVLHNNSMTT